MVSQERASCLLRFTVRALLRQQWVAAGAFAVVWLLILGTPRVCPLLQDSEEP